MSERYEEVPGPLYRRIADDDEVLESASSNSSVWHDITFSMTVSSNAGDMLRSAASKTDAWRVISAILAPPMRNTNLSTAEVRIQMKASPGKELGDGRTIIAQALGYRVTRRQVDFSSGTHAFGFISIIAHEKIDRPSWGKL